MALISVIVNGDLWFSFQIEGDTFKNRTYVDEVEWVAFKYQTGLPARGIILSPVWVIQSEKYWISLEGNV